MIEMLSPDTRSADGLRVVLGLSNTAPVDSTIVHSVYQYTQKFIQIKGNIILRSLSISISAACSFLSVGESNVAASRTNLELQHRALSFKSLDISTFLGPLLLQLQSCFESIGGGLLPGDESGETKDFDRG